VNNNSTTKARLTHIRLTAILAKVLGAEWACFRLTKTVKRSLLTEGHGIPIGLVVAGANRNDMKLVRETIESIVAERPEPTSEQPQGMCLDKGYDFQEVRDVLAEFGFTAHIRARGEEAQAIKR